MKESKEGVDLRIHDRFTHQRQSTVLHSEALFKALGAHSWNTCYVKTHQMVQMRSGVIWPFVKAKVCSFFTTFTRSRIAKTSLSNLSLAIEADNPTPNSSHWLRQCQDVVRIQNNNITMGAFIPFSFFHVPFFLNSVLMFKLIKKHV